MRSPSIVALVAVITVRLASAVDVTECGQVVASGNVATLRNDLACTAGPTWPFSALGVYLHGGASLELNGFTISGDGSGTGVYCNGSRRCTIRGPGEVRAFWAGVNCGGCRIAARDVVFRDNVNGIYIPLAGRLDAERVVASDNAEEGIWAQSVRGEDVEASGNGRTGVSALRKLRIRGLEALVNGGPGVRGGPTRGRLVDSVVTGNDVTGGGYDVVSVGRMRLVRTDCGRSARIRYVSQEEFDVVGSFGCAND